MALLQDPHEVTVSEAAQRGVARLVTEAEQGVDVIVTRRQEPIAAVVSMRRLAAIEEVFSDLHDLALVLARSATDTGRRTSFDEVLAAFGQSRDSLAALPEDE